MECLPTDVLLDILSRLPVKSVLDCKLVCKRFLDLISHPRHQFAKIHHQRQLASNGDDASSISGLLFTFEERSDKPIPTPRFVYKLGNYKPPRLCYGDEYNNEMNIYGNFSHDTLQNTSISYSVNDCVVGSCNGLICLERQHQGNTNIHICNPITGEYVKLPGNALCEEKHWPLFGFGCVNEKYKVVKISFPDDSLNGRIQVYTIGSGSGWRTVGVTSHLYRTSLSGIFANGALYWIDDDKKITAFDLADEEFHLIQSPPCLDDDTYMHCFYTPRVLRGNFCICHHRNEENLLDIWSLKKNTTGASWSRDFSIAYDASGGSKYRKTPARPLLITKKNEVIFVHQRSTLYCYDPKADTVIELWDVDVVNREIQFLSAFPHMNSFVSLEALGERSEKK